MLFLPGLCPRWTVFDVQFAHVHIQQFLWCGLLFLQSSSRDIVLLPPSHVPRTRCADAASIPRMLSILRDSLTFVIISRCTALVRFQLDVLEFVVRVRIHLIDGVMLALSNRLANLILSLVLSCNPIRFFCKIRPFLMRNLEMLLPHI